MNPLNLGLRNLLGILLPGGLIILVALACIAALMPEARPLIERAMTQWAALAMPGVFLVSYVAGSVVCLRAADAVDRLSARLMRLKQDPYKDTRGTVASLRKRLLECVFVSPDNCLPGQNEARWAWKHDQFPYPVWELMKFRIYHPAEMFAFYKQYKHCFWLGDRSSTDDRPAKEFFNYCKTVIFNANEGRQHALAEEVQAAEANTRFFAGTFLALVIALAFSVLLSVVLFFDKSAPHGALPVAAAFTLLVGLAAYSIVAGGRFRLIRLKEVDTVFDAFYLVHRHAAQCPVCGRATEKELFDERRQLVEDAFAAGMTLKGLAGLMRNRSRENPLLSSLYFAGAEHDHPYFLDTDQLAAGISVLPEDEPKSSIAKRHPHQNEVIFALDGEVNLEVLKNGGWEQCRLAAGQVKIVPPGVCHRITSKEKQQSAFLFIKTQPMKEPREEFCADAESGNGN